MYKTIKVKIYLPEKTNGKNISILPGILRLNTRLHLENNDKQSSG